MLAQVPRTLREAEWFRTAFADVHFHDAIPVHGNAAVRRPQTLEPTTMLVAPGGENLFSVLYQLRHEEPAWYERILDTLRAGFPGFERLEFPVVGGGQVTLAWHHTTYEGKPFFANELSAGTLRFLHLITLLLTPRSPTLLLIDEPEDSLHPELMRLLAELLQEAAERTQVIVATQSPALLRWLQPEHVIVADGKDGSCTLSPAKSLKLEQWLAEYSLDRLWQMGQLGGRPEDINHGNPPAHRLRDLFQEGKPPRKYKKPIDGKKLFEKLDLAQVAAVCPEFKALLNTMLALCEYPLLP